MTTPTNRNVLFRLGQVAALVLMAGFGVIDMLSGISTVGSLVVLQVPTAIFAAAVWLPRHEQGSLRLPRAALLLAACSLLVTMVLGAAGGTGASFGTAEALALLGVLFVVSRRGDPAWSVMAVIATIVAVGLLPIRGGFGYEFVIAGLILALAATAAIAGGVYLRTVDSSRRRAMDTVRAEQRAEFARDLHDFIAHHVTGIVVQAQGARFIAEEDPKRAMLALEQIEQAGAETMASMRRMVGVLRDPQARPDAPLAPIAGVPELAQLVQQFTAAGGPLARLHTDGDPHGLPVEVSTSAYRVVMEALTNIRQHAGDAKVVDVWIRRTPDWLLVRVANDGAPPRPALPRERPGYGLVGLTERVKTVGGRISAGPGIDGGWVVDAALPLTMEVGR